MNPLSARDWPLHLPPAYTAHRFEEIGSTNDFLRELDRSHAPHLCLAVARRQSGGRARGDRRWFSEVGNVFWSVLLRPEAHWPEPGTLPFVAALAVHDVVAACVHPSAEVAIKWPNDLLIGGAKVAGILLERSGVRAGAGAGNDERLIVGVGINVAHHPAGAVLYPTTSLAAEGATVSADAVIERLCERFEIRLARWLERGAADALDALRPLLFAVGREVTVRPSMSSDESITGTLRGVDGSGHLVLDVAGERRRIFSGDVFAL